MIHKLKSMLKTLSYGRRSEKRNLPEFTGFTLVEMLIVIGIFAILVAVVVTVLNPNEFFKQTRDSRRMVDLQTLNKALNLADFDNISMGTSSVVYVSIPDTSATCANLGLPASSTLGVGWNYACSTSANYRKNNGTGWVPVDFTSLVTVPSALTILPIDPTNSTSTGLYYTYVNGSWELTSLFETTSYQTKYGAVDNGASTLLYELGNHLKVTPNAVSWRPYMSVYPPSQSDDYVKATSKYSTSYPYLATNPTISLIGVWNAKSWLTGNGALTPNRFHIDLGSGKIVKRIYYEPFHSSGGELTWATKNFTFWGSNTAGDFADLVYADDGTWTQLTTDTTVMTKHVASDIPDPKYIIVTNTNAYRYYAFKFADGWGPDWMGIRRIELQVNQ